VKEPSSISDVLGRLSRAKHANRDRDQLVLLCQEMYTMSKSRKSGYLGANSAAWRGKVPVEYWESSNRPHNVVDILTAVLAGHPPQYHVTIPGNVASSVPSRAEKFLTGVWRLNSRRQMKDLERAAIFRTVLDGQVALRVYWNPSGVRPNNVEVVDNPDQPDSGDQWTVATYHPNDFPVVIELVKIEKIYTLGRGTLGRPYDQLFHVENRTPNQVLYEWYEEDGANVEFIKGLKEDDREIEEEYVEWWGRKANGDVWHAVVFKNKYIIKPRPINYPDIPYVLTSFKQFDDDNPNMKSLPFLYSILWATEREEYMSSRATRLTDMYANLPPVFRGNSPINLEGTWGKVANLAPDERLEFPVWPGNPPDVYKLIDDLRNKQAEGTFSSAMFGNVPGRTSGYALSQLIGADTIRTDTPRANLELAFSAVGDLIFQMMQRFSEDIHISVLSQVQNRKLAAMLSGSETLGVVLETFVKPKQTSDEVRLASLGAQMASLPNPPVSMQYILEKYFSVYQPEDELARKMSEDAMKDPMVRMIALLEVLKDSNSPYAPLVEAQLQKAVEAAASGGGPGSPTQPPGMDQLGLGVPQALMGNEPQPDAMGDTLSENPDLESNMFGGPTNL
jgi:hypothetical protein